MLPNIRNYYFRHLINQNTEYYYGLRLLEMSHSLLEVDHVRRHSATCIGSAVVPVI